MAGMPRARLGSLTAALLVLASASPAGAATNSVALSGTLAMATTASVETPANTGFEWSHHITTSPAGSQPDTADSFTVLFPSPLILNAQDFPACTAQAVDGQPALTADCQNAMIGSGTATMYAGSPGSPLGNSVREDLVVTVLNGTPAGSSILLVVNSTPSAPVVLRNRVLSAQITPQPGYAFGVAFGVPSDLQKQLGLSIVISDLDVTISGTPRPITVGAQTRNISYLQLPDCGTALPMRQLTFFRIDSPVLTMVTSDTSVPCAMGSFPDPAGFPTAPYTSPRVPAAAPEAPAAPAEQLITVASGRPNLGRVKAGRDGRIPLPGLRVSCPAKAPGPCSVSGRATRRGVLVAAGNMRLAAGAYSAFTLKLTRAGKRLLARERSLALAAAVEVTPGGSPAANKTLRLRVVR